MPPIVARCHRKACNHRGLRERRRQVGFSILNKTPALPPVKLPALRADVPAQAAIKTPVLYILLRVIAGFISLISSPMGRKFAHCTALPFPTEPALLGFGGSPDLSSEVAPNCRKLAPLRRWWCLHPASVRKPHTGAYMGQQGVTLSVHPPVVCNQCSS